MSVLDVLTHDMPSDLLIYMQNQTLQMRLSDRHRRMIAALRRAEPGDDVPSTSELIRRLIERAHDDLPSEVQADIEAPETADTSK